MRDLRLGIGLSRKSGGAFSPSSLFAGGIAGVWYDPSDLSSMWQDSAGTTPAAVDSPVGKINDKSGNGNHAVQATAAARPMLRQSGAVLYLDFDGVDDRLTGTLAANMTQPSAMFAGVKVDSGAVTPDMFEAGNGAGTRNGLLIRTGNFVVYAGAILDIAAVDANDRVLYGLFNGASGSGQLDASSAVNGSVGTQAPTSGQNITIGARGDGGAAELFDGRVYGALYLNRTPSAGEIAQMRTYLAAKQGRVL